jgi:hypothetical protein
MDVQLGGGFPIVDSAENCLQDMIERQIKFQKHINKWDDRLRDFGRETFCLPNVALHHLDMGAQECSEAWDMLEGGWKHHKCKPNKTDRTELMLELVDVAHFLINAYLFMGGQSDKHLVAAAVGRSRESLKLPYIDFQYVWDLGGRSWVGNKAKIEALYSHGEGAHGEDWEKVAATSVNYLRSKINTVSDAIRHGLSELPRAKRQHDTFPPASGFVFIETMPWLCVAVQCLPDSTVEEFYSAFIHKNDINFQRQAGGY